MKNNYSLFDIEDNKNDISPKIDVVKLSYEGAESLSWKDLFEGYDRLYAITFSSGINFVYDLLDLFEEATVIFGCENVMSYSISEIMAFQNNCIEKLRNSIGSKKEHLIKRIEDQTVKFYVSNKKMSHEKIYLLESNDGRKRVVMGSANMSFNAFSGKQRENICYLDDERAYDWYMDIFLSFKNECTDNITKKAFLRADLLENIDDLPIMETTKVKRMMVIETCKEDSEEVEFHLSTQKLSNDLKKVMPKPDKKGKYHITSDDIVKLRKIVINNDLKEKELRSEYPQLVVDVFNNTVTLNDEKLNLFPTSEEIKHDVDLFIKYMEGYQRFHGDSTSMQYRYFEFANWFFCSPLMATMRDQATKFNQNKLPYPVFGLVYGQSKAGKTSFLETLLKMMIGQKPKLAAPEFTRSSIEGLKRTVKGAPIIVDDLTNTRFSQHAIETIKNDDFGVSEHLTDYSAVVISANEDVKAVAPEVIRRTVICRVEAGLTNTEVMKSNIVRSVQQKIGTAFYREYLRRMLEVVPDLIDQLRDEETMEAPDILKYSSQVIVDIVSENCKTKPLYIKELSIDNYFSEQVTGKHAIKVITKAWMTDKKLFEINKKTNELKYNTGATYEADRLIKELPETLEAHKVRDYVVMKLDVAKEFFGIDFKKSIFGK